MIGSSIDRLFDLIGALWNGFWKVCGRLLGLTLFTLACGVSAAAVRKLLDPLSADAWLYFKGGAALGLLIGGIRLLINEVAVPMVHEQEMRARREARRELDARLARDRVASRRDSVSERLKHLN